MAHNYPTRHAEHGGQSALRRKRGRRMWLMLLLGPGGLLVVVATTAGLAALVIIFTAPREVTRRDRQVLVDAQAVAGHLENFTPNPRRETLLKRRHLNGSWELDYRYDDPTLPHAAYVHCRVSVEPTVAAAVAAYRSLWDAHGPTVMVGDARADIIERNDIFHWGDESRFAIVRVAGADCGNLFVARKGTRVFYLLVTGATWHETLAFSDLVTPPLSHLEAYEP